MNQFNTIEEAIRNAVDIDLCIVKIGDGYCSCCFSAAFIRKYMTSLFYEFVQEIGQKPQKSDTNIDKEGRLISITEISKIRKSITINQFVNYSLPKGEGASEDKKG